VVTGADGQRFTNAGAASQVGKALPPAEYPPIDVAHNHDLFHMLYDVRRIPQIPSIGFWLNTKGLQ